VISLLTTNTAFLRTPGLHSLIIIYFHMEINKGSGITFPPLICISLLIYASMMFVLSNGKRILPTP
jgi:hypothetical protein